MTSHILQTELSNLIQESKRKNSNLKNAAEQSLADLKGLPSTSEAQLAADLIRKPHFVKPFVIACQTNHGRLAAIGVVGIQRLVASRALPPEGFRDVLDGLHQTTNLGLDVQLKVLQTLGALFQYYAIELNGPLLANTLEICATLQNSKTSSVSNTAAATMQQLVVSIFDKVSKTDAMPDSVLSFPVTLYDQQIYLTSASYDALRILDDLCRLVEGEKLEFLNIKSLSKIFVLELIESILVNNGHIFAKHPEQVLVLRNRLMPLTVKHFSGRYSFPLTVRVARILLLLLREYLLQLVTECEMALGLLIHLLDADAAVPWKRVLCMEIFRGLYSDSELIRLIYILFDTEEGRRNIVCDHMACLVKLASEKPYLIGVSHRSTLPTGPSNSRNMMDEQVTLEAVSVAGVIGSPTTKESTCGISSQWSLVRTPYLETLDKIDAPILPETYIYSLALNCISTLSESIAKFILPLTASESKSKRKHRASISKKAGDESALQRKNSGRASNKLSVPINPLDLTSHPQINDIQAITSMIDTCWPAILATCSTFLYAALDGEFYHNLVRSFQKLTHVAGLLRLSTPRDAFLTTLGKAAVPADLSNFTVSLNSPGIDSQDALATESSMPKSTIATDALASTADKTPTALSTRNLLCLRALLNLGIALGPTLDQAAWLIILETLQHAELILNVSTMATPKPASMNKWGDRNAPLTPEPSKVNLGAEIIAVETAAAKMFESTGEYPSTSFKSLLSALLSLSEKTDRGIADVSSGKHPVPSQFTPSSKALGRIHQNKRSISIALGKSRIQDDELKFVLAKVNDLAKSNLERLALPDDEEGIWHILVGDLVSITQNTQINQSLRSNASHVLDNIVFHSIKLGNSDDPGIRNQVQLRGLRALKSQISTLYDCCSNSNSSQRASDFEIHEIALEALKSILEECGESLIAGWDLVFDLISSVFDDLRCISKNGDECASLNNVHKPRGNLTVKSARLVRTAYSSLQLVASDFLSLLSSSCLLELVKAFSSFASQVEDFNISLTSTTSFWNLSDFLRSQVDKFSIESHIEVFSSEETLTELAKSSDLLISRNSLWLVLLLRIADLSTDSRSEIRNAAIQTALRIFDAYGQQLPPKAWHLCLNKVLFVMTESVQKEVLMAQQTSEPLGSNEMKTWIETAVILTKGLSNLIAGYFDTIAQDEGFSQSWKRLLDYLEAIIKIRVLELDEAVFSSFSEVLSRIRGYNDIKMESLESAWAVWVNGHPIAPDEQPDLDVQNQNALIAYLKSFKQLYRLLKDILTDTQIYQVLENLQISVWRSVSSRYTRDVDHQSELQSLTMESLKTICLEKTSSQPALVTCLAEFSDCALTKWSAGQDNRKPTFVAFSKSAMRLLGWYVAEHGILTDIFSNGILTRALEHLSNQIAHKYKWNGSDHDPALWRVATSVSLDILQVAVPYVESEQSNSSKKELVDFWNCVVDISRGIVSAFDYKKSNIQSGVICDEEFDVTAFTRLRDIVIPSLGSPLIPDRTRRQFACALFSSSFVYPIQHSDLPSATLEKEPLLDLYKIRMGRTYDPPPTLRLKMAFLMIDSLFDLAATHSSKSPSHKARVLAHPSKLAPQDAENQYVILAKSVSPYLILRCAISLKSYIADQPLRGLMPQPTPAQKELLYLLHRLVELRSEPAAIPDAGPVAPLGSGKGSNNSGMYKKHLGWVYPFVVRATGVAGKERDDNRVLDALQKVLVNLSGDGLGGHDENDEADAGEDD
ncbi:endosomal peripheral membrane protein [Histoplasma capsulatum]|uniref:Endosomal peripheral membrane protein n=1 Tax=Ajellomyces capsulatus TaxID=5037 RepID=A0A8A1M3T7_AJECA|nr:endosomal peripheral membrane protein [Histoplasma capsulatum]